MQYEKELEFHDANNHIVRLHVEITNRNHYPEFTIKGSCNSHSGQCDEQISPKNEDQTEILKLWNQYHLKDVSKIHNFLENLVGVCERIEYDEKNTFKQTEGKEERIKQLMEEEGIDEDQFEACQAYLEVMGVDNLKDFEESYSGLYSSDEEFAQEQAEETGMLDRDNHWPNNCIDWKQAAYELMMDYSEQDGYYFRNI